MADARTSTAARPRVLFVCTGNAGRSQMAEALARRALGDLADVASAGVAPWDRLHPKAVELLTEAGYDLTGHHPKPVSAHTTPFDLVVTIGDPALTRLPWPLPGAPRWLHWDVDDPARADGRPDSESVFRRCRQQLAARLPELRRLLNGIARPGSWELAPGIGTGLWWPGRFRPAEHLPKAARAGFRTIELNLYLPDHATADSPGTLAEMRRIAAAEGMSFYSIHSPDVASLADPEPAQRARQVEALRRNVAQAVAIGARVVVSHGLVVGPFAKDLAGCQQRLAEELAALAAWVEPTPVLLGFENTGPSGPGYGVADLARQVHANARAACGLVLDPGHANIAGDLAAFFDVAGNRLESLHLNDNNGKKDEHSPPGWGTIDWLALRAGLERVGYRGSLMYEPVGFGRDPDVLLAAVAAAHRAIFAERRAPPPAPQ